MKMNDAFPGSYLKKEDVEKPIVVTIAEVKHGTVEEEGMEKPIIHMTFQEEVKPLIVNKTNWNLITGILGSDDSDNWIGKKIELFCDPNVAYAGKLTGGVRARAVSNYDMTWEEAVKYVFDEGGLAPEDLKAYLKDKGLKGYQPHRDTPLVKQLVIETNDAASAVPLE